MLLQKWTPLKSGDLFYFDPTRKWRAKKRFMLNRIKTESYSQLLINDNYIKSNDISKIEMPVDLNIAYAEYLNQS